jgi:hypothetical protein
MGSNISTSFNSTNIKIQSILNRKPQFYYHTFCFVFLLYLGLFLQCMGLFSKTLLIIIAFIHLYDAWWFYNHNSDAPI